MLLYFSAGEGVPFSPPREVLPTVPKLGFVILHCVIFAQDSPLEKHCTISCFMATSYTQSPQREVRELPLRPLDPPAQLAAASVSCHRDRGLQTSLQRQPRGGASRNLRSFFKCIYFSIGFFFVF